MVKGRNTPYEENHRDNNGTLEKKCGKHYIHFPEENPWIPCTDEFFYKSKSSKKDGLNTWCKKCTKQDSYIWRKNNKEKWKVSFTKQNNRPERKILMKVAKIAYRKDGKKLIWDRAHPEKCREYTKNHRNHDITESEWNNCLKVFGYKCAYCGITEEKHLETYNQMLHKEHVDSEGANDISNAIPACQSCNSRKWEFIMDEWYRSQEHFSEERLNFINHWINGGYKEFIEDKPPYRIVKKKNKNNVKFHHELWTVDEMRNMVECIYVREKKMDIVNYIKTIALEEIGCDLENNL